MSAARFRATIHHQQAMRIGAAALIRAAVFVGISKALYDQFGGRDGGDAPRELGRVLERYFRGDTAASVRKKKGSLPGCPWLLNAGFADLSLTQPLIASCRCKEILQRRQTLTHSSLQRLVA
jgi:hypothetical protein